MGAKQHYIPRLLLRQFSIDDKHKQINLFLLNSNSKIEKASLYNQAYGHNIYGSDQLLEKKFQKVEDEIGHIIRKLLSEDLDLTRYQRIMLSVFILIQRNRTPEAIKQEQQTTANLLANLEMDNKRSNGKDHKLKTIINKIKKTNFNPYELLFYTAVKSWPAVIDLKLGLLKNETNEEFIIGEHPVVILNPFLCKRKWRGSRQGIGVKGATIILPISPIYSIILFDNNIYKLSNFKRIISISPNDVAKINYLLSVFAKF